MQIILTTFNSHITLYTWLIFLPMQNVVMKKRIVFLFALLVVIISCSKSVDNTGGNGGTNTCTNVPKSFSSDVNPIIQSTCTINSGCHGSNSVHGPGELLTYTQIFNARVSIKNAVASGLMPQTGSLTTAQKNIIICWVESGAPNN